MKVHHDWSENRIRCWPTSMLLAAAIGMLMQQQYAALAAVIVPGNIRNNSSGDSEISSSRTNRHVWPPMKHHDIWSDIEMNTDVDDVGRSLENYAESFDEVDNYEFVASSFDGIQKAPYMAEALNDKLFWPNNTISNANVTQRQSKVLHLFPVPVDGECLSDDGRRTGICFNAYECRQKGGVAKGDCAMGFGVCCIFIANCNDIVSNNITYLVSPQFPSFMPNNFSSCAITVKLMSEDVSQLRIDFNHFSFGQPNRRTGICDGDVFNISGGPGGTFSLCGQNSGQHIYYDVGGRVLPRQTLYGSLRPPTLAQLYPNQNGSSLGEQLITITMNFAQRFLPIRLWEIRIAQIPFSQRAPAGCLQYYFGTEGVIQTFNFADNGRHLANQHYRVCIRQETEMCSIIYQPCDEQSFRIGPSMPFREMPNQTGGMGVVEGAAGGGAGGGAPTISNGAMPAAVSQANMPPLPTMTTVGAMPVAALADDAMVTAQVNATTLTAMPSTSTVAMTNAATTSSTMTEAVTTSGSSSAATTPAVTTTTIPTTTTNATRVSAAPAAPTTSTAATSTMRTTIATSPLSDDVEGSGDDVIPITPATSNVSRRPRPVTGGFDLLGFLRSAFELSLRHRRNGRARLEQQLQAQRTQRQIFSTCSDRITLPCIIEDFIGTNFGPLPSCEPVHCGTQFCSSGVWPCRIESTVTPFFMNIHFGSGLGKGSAEDNIGACLRYTQMQCM